LRIEEDLLPYPFNPKSQIPNLQSDWGVAGELFNVACGERYTVLDLVAELNEILDKDVEPIFTESRKADVKHSMADVSKAKELLKYYPITDFVEGLNRTVRWFNQELKD